jgi:glutathione synthase/RimK-type ligase-like ATP-grasp enzyme
LGLQWICAPFMEGAVLEFYKCAKHYFCSCLWASFYMKIAVLTCAKCSGLSPRDHHLPGLFNHKGVGIVSAVWDDPAVNWSAFDGLLFRSVWDYHLKPTEFNNWLDFIALSGIKTLNPIETVKQNQHKFYLQYLQNQGVEIVPTTFIPKTDVLDISAVVKTGWDRAVIKPAISASSYMTNVFAVSDWKQTEREYAAVAKERDLLLQAFMPEVIGEGELSLVFFNRRYSHAVLKWAVKGDFRVQAEFGGAHEAINPSKAIISTAEHILSLVPGPLLYARVDGLVKSGRFVLMELELLEPDLYFDSHPEASARYVSATMELMNDMENMEATMG